MSKFYAQLNEATNVCESVSQLSAAVIAPNMIELADYDESKVGMLYDSSNQTWSAVTVVEPAIRVISVGAFRKRLPPSCRKNIRESAIDAIIDIREDLEFASYIDLDDPELLTGLQSLSQAGLGWLTDAELVIMTSDGTTKEKYSGVL